MRIILAVTAALTVATPAIAGTSGTYGPPAPEPTDHWQYPDRFIIEADETEAEARAKVDRTRRDATRWEIGYQVLNMVDAVGFGMEAGTIAANLRFTF